jgi:DNA-binding HxlR family transcriptional regulator
MIDRELLRSNGTVEILERLFAHGEHTTGELAAEVDLSETTVRRRIERLEVSELVEIDAAIRDGDAVRVYKLTPVGERDARALDNLVGFADVDTPTTSTESTTPDTRPAEDTASGTRTDTSDDTPPRPSGVTFDNDNTE